MQILGGILKWSNYLKTKDAYFKILITPTYIKKPFLTPNVQMIIVYCHIRKLCLLQTRGPIQHLIKNLINYLMASGSLSLVYKVFII